jgi:hypothetical protein
VCISIHQLVSRAERLSACGSRAEHMLACFESGACILIQFPVSRAVRVSAGAERIKSGARAARIKSQACICVCLRFLRARHVSACVCTH